MPLVFPNEELKMARTRSVRSMAKEVAGFELRIAHVVLFLL